MHWATNSMGLGSFRAYLESEDRHAINTIAGYALNFSYIFFLLFLADMFGIVGMMIAVVRSYK